MKRTNYRVFHVDGTTTSHMVEWPEDPGYDRIRILMEPILSGGHLEHVTVLHGGRAADMFVDEEGLIKGLPRNEAATKIYRNNWLTKHPKTDPETISFIAGNAVLFERRVWF